MGTNNDSINFGTSDSKPKVESSNDNSLTKSKPAKVPKQSKSEKKLNKKKDVNYSAEDDSDEVLEDIVNEDLDVNSQLNNTEAISTKKVRKEQKSTVRIDHRDSTLDHYLVHGKLDPEIHRQTLPGHEYGINHPVVFTEKGDPAQSQEEVAVPKNVMNLATVIP